MKIVLYMAQTLNGYIAGVNDEAPWSDELWNAYYKYIKVTGNLIVGRKTYEIMLTYGNEFEKLGNPFTVVVTSQTKFKSIEKTRFVKSIKTALQEIEDMGFDRAIIGEGQNLIKVHLRKMLLMRLKSTLSQ